LRIFSFICLYFLISVIGWNQTNASFTDVSFDLNLYEYYYGGNFGTGVSFFDFDEDGWDDLTICHQSGSCVIYKNNAGFFEVFQAFEIQQAKSCLWGDLQNDGDNELIFTTINSGIIIYESQSNGYYQPLLNNVDWMDQISSTNNLWLYGISLADVNQDNLLDIAVATYQGETPNFLFINNGNLQFELAFNTALKYEQKMSFQPAFADINKDNKPDLYFANDFEEGNDFYYNIPTDSNNSSWENASSITGLDINVNGMCNSWCDFDNDLDLDVYVSNLDPGNYLMSNDNQIFNNIAPSAGLAVYGKCWSSLWIDANNDQWSDLLVSSAHADIDYSDWNGYYFSALGQGNFSEMDTNIFTSSSYSACKGDINNDGLYDIALNAANEDFFQLYLNTTNSSNHFLKLKFNGVQSNRNGVGIHYYLYTEDNQQYGYTQYGENYLGQNSQNIILGTGNNTTTDSLILIWPSGIVDKYYNLSIDQFHILYEGQSGWGLTLSADQVCSGQDSVLAMMNNTFSAIWDNNLTAQNMWMHPGNHSVLIQYNGTSIDTILFTIGLYNDETTLIEVTGEHCNAADGEVIIRINSDTLYHMTNLSDGPHVALYNNSYGCPVIDTISIPAEDYFEPLFSTNPAACQQGSLGSIQIPEQPQVYYTSEPTIDPNGVLPGQYQLHFSNISGCILDTTIFILSEQQWEISIPDTIETCLQQIVQPEDWLESNLPVVLYGNWPIEPMTTDSVLTIIIETDQGCSISDSLYFNITYPPQYTVTQETQSNGSLILLQTENFGHVYFQNNGSGQIFCTESQWIEIVLLENNCQWDDSIWVEIELPQNMQEIETNEAWILHHDILFNKTTNTPKEIKQIVNVLGQRISYTPIGFNQWKIETGQYPIFIFDENKWNKVQIQQP
jgi:hypothetical protein